MFCLLHPGLHLVSGDVLESLFTCTLQACLQPGWVAFVGNGHGILPALRMSVAALLERPHSHQERLLAAIACNEKRVAHWLVALGLCDIRAVYHTLRCTEAEHGREMVHVLSTVGDFAIKADR